MSRQPSRPSSQSHNEEREGKIKSLFRWMSENPGKVTMATFVLFLGVARFFNQIPNESTLGQMMGYEPQVSEELIKTFESFPNPIQGSVKNLLARGVQVDQTVSAIYTISVVALTILSMRTLDAMKGFFFPAQPASRQSPRQPNHVTGPSTAGRPGKTPSTKNAGQPGPSVAVGGGHAPQPRVATTASSLPPSSPVKPSSNKTAAPAPQPRTGRTFSPSSLPPSSPAKGSASKPTAAPQRRVVTTYSSSLPPSSPVKGSASKPTAPASQPRAGRTFSPSSLPPSSPVKGSSGKTANSSPAPVPQKKQPGSPAPTAKNAQPKGTATANPFLRRRSSASSPTTATASNRNRLSSGRAGNSRSGTTLPPYSSAAPKR